MPQPVAVRSDSPLGGSGLRTCSSASDLIGARPPFIDGSDLKHADQRPNPLGVWENSMRHLAVLLAVLLGAILSYAAGFQSGILLFIAVGVMLELTFWVLAFRGDRSSRAND